MNALTLKKSSWLLAAVFASLAWMGMPQKSFAADTQVTCFQPQIQLAAGRDGSKPRVTVYCSGGSSEGSIVFFAAEISANANVADAIPTVLGTWETANGAGTAVTILSNLDDLSGSAWGCGTGNCRIIDYLYGY